MCEKGSNLSRTKRGLFFPEEIYVQLCELKLVRGKIECALEANGMGGWGGRVQEEGGWDLRRDLRVVVIDRLVVSFRQWQISSNLWWMLAPPKTSKLGPFSYPLFSVFHFHSSFCLLWSESKWNLKVSKYRSRVNLMVKRISTRQSIFTFLKLWELAFAVLIKMYKNFGGFEIFV